MYLTPGSFRKLHQHLPILLTVLCFSAACVTRVPTPPVLTPEPARPRAELPPSLPPRVSVVLRPDSAVYDALVSTITTELSPGEGRDTLVTRESMRISLTANSRSAFTLRLTSDSGFTLPQDRRAPPESIRSQIYAKSIAAQIDQAGVTIVLPPVLPNICASIVSSHKSVARRLDILSQPAP